jgi:hypothetical protein
MSNWDQGADNMTIRQASKQEGVNEGAHRLYQRLGYEADKEILIHHKPYWHMVKALH